MDKKGLFKPTVFGGFNKDDVLTYFDALGKTYQDRIGELEGRLSAINQERNLYAGEVQTQSVQLDTLKRQIEESKNQNQLLLKQALEQKKVLQNQSTKSRSYEHEIAKLRLECNDLIKSIDFHKEKSQKYDELNESIGETILGAQRLSKEIIEDSKIQAREIADETKRSMDGFANQIIESKASVTEIRERITDIYSEFGLKMQELEYSMGDIVHSLSTEDSYYAFLDDRKFANMKEQLVQKNQQAVNIQPENQATIALSPDEIAQFHYDETSSVAYQTYPRRTIAAVSLDDEKTQQNQFPDEQFNLPKNNNFFSF